ncbi:hypothetical protein F7725_013207 [Dissostichus mawsoni]|uniref:Uncharacterized protein n=1 Tax=Dissostichus mawsoni TaxID=36200 RepID=A0A7J5YPV8_DISMA|nr:hypothetical protein F7725_013207 [Dissostichus mawsoni]
MVSDSNLSHHSCPLTQNNLCCWIMSQYSVVLLVEVTDVTGDNRSNPYGMKCSEPLGPEGHKEKKKEVRYRSYQYGGNDEDVITRSLSFSFSNDLVLIPVHTKPRNAEAELNALHDVVEDLRRTWQNDKETIRISSARYHWLVYDDVNTITSNNNPHRRQHFLCLLKNELCCISKQQDRGLRKEEAGGHRPHSAKAYNFKEELNLTDEETQSVSDQYPVEEDLKQKQKRLRKIAQDFSILFAEPAPKLFETWVPLYADKIILYIDTRNCPPTDARGEVALMLLPVMLPPPVYKQGRKLVCASRN